MMDADYEAFKAWEESFWRTMSRYPKQHEVWRAALVHRSSATHPAAQAGSDAEDAKKLARAITLLSDFGKKYRYMEPRIALNLLEAIRAARAQQGERNG